MFAGIGLFIILFFFLLTLSSLLNYISVISPFIFTFLGPFLYWLIFTLAFYLFGFLSFLGFLFLFMSFSFCNFQLSLLCFYLLFIKNNQLSPQNQEIIRNSSTEHTFCSLFVSFTMASLRISPQFVITIGFFGQLGGITMNEQYFSLYWVGIQSFKKIKQKLTRSWLFVCTDSIFFTTSIPFTTCPNTTCFLRTKSRQK